MSEVARYILIIIILLLALMSISGGLIYAERRLLALWQDRYGPNRAGPFGVLQVVADIVKILMKEDWVPPFADRVVFVLAPMIVVLTTLLSFAVVVFAPQIAVADRESATSWENCRGEGGERKREEDVTPIVYPTRCAASC